MQYQVNCTLELKGGCHDWNADYMNGGQVALWASCAARELRRGKLRCGNYAAGKPRCFPPRRFKT